MTKLIVHVFVCMCVCRFRFELGYVLLCTCMIDSSQVWIRLLKFLIRVKRAFEIRISIKTSDKRAYSHSNHRVQLI